LRESTAPNEQLSFATFDTLVPRNELNVVVVSDSSTSSSTNHFSEGSLTQDSQDTTCTLTNTAAV